MNDDELAADIRRVFGRYRMEPRALVAPDPGSRASFVTRRRAFGLSLAGAGLAIVLGLGFTFGLAPAGQAPSALAAWQPVPTKPDQGMRDVAHQACREAGPWSPGGTIAGTTVTFDSLPLLVQDQRGPTALFIFGSGKDGTIVADCLIWRGPKGPIVLGAGSMSWPADFPRTDLELMGTGGQSIPVAGDRSGETAFASEVYGRTTGTRVVVVRADGVRVDATVVDGMFVAWWPGGVQTASLEAYDDQGAQIATQSVKPVPTPCICRINEPAAPTSGN
jgi:hypothetical protein